MNYANQVGYSDVYPFEVVRRISEKCIELRAMSYERHPDWKPEIAAGGFAGHCVNNQSQQWIIKSDPHGGKIKIRLHKDGRWRDANGNRYLFDEEPCRFYDYNF